MSHVGSSKVLLPRMNNYLPSNCPLPMAPKRAAAGKLVLKPRPPRPRGSVASDPTFKRTARNASPISVSLEESDSPPELPSLTSTVGEARTFSKRWRTIWTDRQAEPGSCPSRVTWNGSIEEWIIHEPRPESSATTSTGPFH